MSGAFVETDARVAAIAEHNPRVRCFFTVTRLGEEKWNERVGRIDEAMLRDADLDREALFYVCGPPGFPETMQDALTRLGVDTASRVKAESW